MRCRYVSEERCCRVPYTTCRMVQQECTCMKQETVVTKEPYCVTKKVRKTVAVCVPVCE